MSFLEDGERVDIKAGEYYIQKEGTLQKGVPIIDPPMYFYIHFCGTFVSSPTKRSIAIRGKVDIEDIRQMCNIAIMGGKTYYFVETNSAAYTYTGGWKKFGKKYRYFDKKGVMKTGWLKVKGKYYYLDTKTGYRTVGLKKLGGKTYYFVEKNSAAYRYSGWKKFGKKMRYFDKNGVMAVGKQKIDGKTYKFDKNGYRK